MYLFDKLPEDKKFLTAGLGSEESILEAFNSSIINPTGNDIVIPLTVFGQYYTGFLVIKEGRIKAHRIIPDFGYAFSHTLLKPDPSFSEHVFVFQNPLLALQLICRYYDVTGIFPPVVAEPQLNIINSLDTFPKAQIIYVVEKLIYRLLPDLYQFGVRICDESVAQTPDPHLQLKTYISKSTSLSGQFTVPVSPDLKRRVMVIRNMWVSLPHGSIICNCDVRLIKCYINRNYKLYRGVVRHKTGKKAYFWWDGNRSLLAIVKETCINSGIPFRITPSFEKKFENFVVSRSGSVKTIKPCAKNKVKPILTLPEIIITPHGVVPTRNEFPEVNYPGVGVTGDGEKKGFQDPLLPQNINQIVVFLAVATTICRSVMSTNADSKKLVGTFLLGPHSPELVEFLKILGIPQYPPTEPSPNDWPVFYPELPRTLFTSPFNYPYVALVSPLDLAVAMCCRSISVFGITDYWYPIYNPNSLRNNLIAFLQRLLVQHKFRIGSGEKMFNLFVEFFEFPPEVRSAIADRVILVSPYEKHYKTARLVAEIIKIGELPLPRIKNGMNLCFSTRDLNDYLKKLGYPRVFSEKSPKVYVHTQLLKRCLNSTFYDMSRKIEFKERWEYEIQNCMDIKKLFQEE